MSEGDNTFHNKFMAIRSLGKLLHCLGVGNNPAISASFYNLHDFINRMKRVSEIRKDI